MDSQSSPPPAAGAQRSIPLALQELLDRAHRHYCRSEFFAAQDLLEEAISGFPDRSEPLELYPEVLGLLDLHHKEIEAYLKLAKFRPSQTGLQQAVERCLPDGPAYEALALRIGRDLDQHPGSPQALALWCALLALVSPETRAVAHIYEIKLRALDGINFNAHLEEGVRALEELLQQARTA